MEEKAYKGNTRPIYKGLDYTNKTIGNWTVLGPIECIKAKGKNYKTKWLCQCSCNSNPQYVYKENLLKGMSSGCRECYPFRNSKENNSNWRGYKEIPSTIITRIKNGAKIRNIEYILTEESLYDSWVKSNGICSISGLKIDLYTNASLDRIDSSIGYTPQNIQWVDKDINIMKNNMPENKFIELCKTVSNYNKITK